MPPTPPLPPFEPPPLPRPPPPPEVPTEPASSCAPPNPPTEFPYVVGKTTDVELLPPKPAPGPFGKTPVPLCP